MQYFGNSRTGYETLRRGSPFIAAAQRFFFFAIPLSASKRTAYTKNATGCSTKRTGCGKSRKLGIFYRTPFVLPLALALPIADGSRHCRRRASYYRLRLHCFSVTGLGNVDGVHIRFNLYTSNQDAVDSDLYNENVLFAAGETTPLPPVTITHPYGLNGQWIIQDTESMIDLSFFPVSDTVRKKSILILRTEYHTIYGKCEGTVRDKHGTKFTLKDFCAVAKKQYLRL